MLAVLKAYLLTYLLTYLLIYLGALKGTLVLAVLKANRHVLLSDVDVVWLQDPLPLLRDLSVHADVMSATDCLHVTDDERKFPR